jgi:hypothetical protein
VVIGCSANGKKCCAFVSFFACQYGWGFVMINPRAEFPAWEVWHASEETKKSTEEA